jgi:ferritin
MNKKVLDLINSQINHEFYSAYFYLSMAAHSESVNLPGMAKWLSMQAKEEQGHALKFYGYLLDRSEMVVLQAIAQPPVTFGSPKEIFKLVYEHEQKVTGLINGIYEAAVAEKDYPTQILCQWFINEQVEEEKNASTILDMLTKVGDNLGALYQYDHVLGMRAGD